MMIANEKTAEALPEGMPHGVETQTIPCGGSTSQLLMLPCADRDDTELLDRARAWVESSPDSAEKGLLISLQGAQVLWSPRRAAVLAPADRLSAVRPALIEFSLHEAALREIEREIESGWPDLETDSPLAFDFDSKAMGRRAELAQRFQRIIGLRARLARLTPQVHRPLIHPPTVASQVSERLRERTRLIDRLEFVAGQLEVFERVYDLCGQRSSDYMQSRKGHTLEIIIIIVLGVQLILYVLELLSHLTAK